MATPITLSEPKHFRIHQSAITFGFNDLGDANNVAISVYTNAKVSVYIDGIIPLTPADEARQWTLTAFPTHFNDDVARYCHIAVSREGSAATLVFPSSRVDLYGRPITDDGTAFLPDGGETSPSADPDHYFLFFGKITARGEAPNGGRDWASIAYPIYGILDTIRYWQEESGSEWTNMFQYDDTRSLIRVLKPLINAQFVAPIKLLIGSVTKVISNLFTVTDTDESILPAGTDPNTPAATAHLDTVLPTEAHMRDYGERNHLSRTHDDTAQGNITFNQSIAVLGDASIGANTSVVGNITSGGHIGSDDFQTGLLASGWRADHDGHAEFDSLSIRKFIEVPELRFNRISVRTGVQWQTFGGGLIEAVYPAPDGNPRRGIIKLHLEDGEYGTIVPDDKCMGIFHFEGDPDGGASAPSPSASVASGSAVGSTAQDDHNGNFAFAGFSTIYFRVIAICDEHGDTTNPDPSNRYFLYELRPDWRMNGFDHDIASKHPQPSMSFAAYANPRDEDRQACEYSTTEYTIQLAGMTDWTYDSTNIQFIYGHLSGFTISVRVPKRDAQGNLVFDNGTPVYDIVSYPLRGYGLATGNIYKWGNETTIERPRTLISQQLYYCASALPPEQFLTADSQLSTLNSQLNWQTTPLSPSPATPYVYAFWLKTYIEGSIESQERSSAFLLATYGESAITPRWSQPIVPIYVKQSGWIIDDVPPTITQLEYEQRVSVTVSLAKGIDEYIPISSITLADLDDTQHPTIADLATTPLTLEGHTWRIEFTVRDFTLADSVTLAFSLVTPNGSVAAPLVLSPTFSGSDGSNGSDGLDATLYEIEPSQNNFIVDPEETEVVTTAITFRVFRIDGNQPRQPLRGFYYRVEFFEQTGDLIPDIPVIGQYSQDPEVTIPLATSLYHITMAEILHYIKFSVIAEDQTEIKTVTVTRVNSGEAGPQGIPGQDGLNAVTYTLEPTADAYRTNTAGSATESWGATLYRSVGNVRTPHQQTSWTITLGYEGGMYTDQTYTGASFTLTARNIGMAQSIRVTASDATTAAVILTRTYYPTPYGPKGEQGLQGLIIRPCGQWSPTERYVNQSNIAADPDEVRYIDIVVYNIDGIPHVFMCKPTADGSYNINHLPTDGTYWRMADECKFIATDVLLANNAYIKFGQNNQLLILDTNGVIIGGFTGYATDTDGNPVQNPIRLWIGATDPTDAPFHVKHDGTAVTANINTEFQDISGLSSSELTAFEGEMQTVLLSDLRSGNPLYRRVDGVIETVPIKPRIYNIVANNTNILLPCDAAYIGQRVIICNTDEYPAVDEETATQVHQETPEGFSDKNFDMPFYGAGFWSRRYTDNGQLLTGMLYKNATSIAFVNGTMEFVGIPYILNGQTYCRWSLITDGTCCKWFACQWKLVDTNPPAFIEDWVPITNS